MLNFRVAENTSVRLLLATAALAGIFAGAQLLRRGHAQFGEVGVKPVDLERVPRQLADWTAVQGPLSGPVDAKPYESVAHLTRVYRNSGGRVVNLLVDAFPLWDNPFAAWDTVRLHPPEFCYPANGYVILGSKDVPLGHEASSGETARLVMFRRGTQQICVLYWYQLAGQIIVAQFGATSINREVWKQSIRPPVLKIMLETASSREDVAEERLRNIAAALRTSLKRPL
jgi:hypothetical protein